MCLAPLIEHGHCPVDEAFRGYLVSDKNGAMAFEETALSCISSRHGGSFRVRRGGWVASKGTLSVEVWLATVLAFGSSPTLASEILLVRAVW